MWLLVPSNLSPQLAANLKLGFGFRRVRVRAVASHCGGPSTAPGPALQSDASSPPGRCLALPRQTPLQERGCGANPRGEYGERTGRNPKNPARG
jgi:hypothetical protein